MLNKDAEKAHKAFMETRVDGFSMTIERGTNELVEMLKEEDIPGQEETCSLERRIILSMLRSRGFMKTREVLVKGVSADEILGAEYEQTPATIGA